MNNDRREYELQCIAEAQTKGPFGKSLIYSKLSGPGWLQGAMTLGGNSLTGALYLGVIAGFNLLWLQPMAMVCGIIMLSAISYVTLSIERRPFGAINQHVSPLLGWSWLIATVLANIVWCMPQYSLATAAVQQNLFPSLGTSTACSAAICIVLFIIASIVNVLYEMEGRGVKIFDIIIKMMVGMIVLSFIAVVTTLTYYGAIPWSYLFSSIVPSPSNLFSPADTYSDLISQSSHSQWWTNKIVSDQRDIILTAFGTAVGINMTWLFPYSLLKKRWGKKHRGLVIFDLSIGLFIPFFLATSCVLIASASQFHGKTDDVFRADGSVVPEMEKAYRSVIDEFAKENSVEFVTAPPLDGPQFDSIPEPDRQLAAMLAKRDNFQLATTLEPLAGKTVAQTIFGFGVLGMALSTIIILMLINGLAFQELLMRPDSKPVYFLGCLIAGAAGIAGPFIWTTDARAALAVPTSVIGGSLIPIAYFTFLLLMNSKKVLGNKRPKGRSRLIWNVLMIGATSIATFGSVWVLASKANFNDWQGIFPVIGLVMLVVLFLVGTFSFVKHERAHADEATE